MTYQVIVQPGAKLQLYKNALWWAEYRDLDQAVRWLTGFEEALATLAQNPKRHGRIRESELVSWDHTYQELLYGVSRRPTHRAIYRIQGDMVYVVAIRHLAQDDLEPNDVT